MLLLTHYIFKLERDWTRPSPSWIHHYVYDSNEICISHLYYLNSCTRGWLIASIEAIDRDQLAGSSLSCF